IGQDGPLFLGESLYASGATPAAFADVGGEPCFLGWHEARKGVGLLAKMMAEGYRWHEVAAVHFWLGPDRSDLHYNSWQPVCVLCREWNWTFAGGQPVKRTLKVFNDTHSYDPIDVRWVLTVGGKVQNQGGRTFSCPAGGALEHAVTFPAPKVKERTAAEWVLTCSRGGREVFREVKPCWVIDPDGAPAVKVAKQDLVVL